jgi:hypothetical protein
LLLLPVLLLLPLLLRRPLPPLLALPQGPPRCAVLRWSMSAAAN